MVTEWWFWVVTPVVVTVVGLYISRFVAEIPASDLARGDHILGRGRLGSRIAHPGDKQFAIAFTRRPDRPRYDHHRSPGVDRRL